MRRLVAPSEASRTDGRWSRPRLGELTPERPLPRRVNVKQTQAVRFHLPAEWSRLCANLFSSCSSCFAGENFFFPPNTFSCLVVVVVVVVARGNVNFSRFFFTARRDWATRQVGAARLHLRKGDAGDRAAFGSMCRSCQALPCRVGRRAGQSRLAAAAAADGLLSPASQPWSLLLLRGTGVTRGQPSPLEKGNLSLCPVTFACSSLSPSLGSCGSSLGR